MIAVDVISVLTVITNIIEGIALFGLTTIGALCAWFWTLDQYRARHDRQRTCAARTGDHPTSNVVRLVPRGRHYDWQADEDYAS